MSREFREHDLEAYLDEALPADEMARIEEALRHDPQLRDRLAEINARRDAGVHSLGEIWRRHRISCPDRTQLGAYLLGTLDEAVADYIRFHIEVVGCRYCEANLRDLKEQAEADEGTASRRRKFFQSSVGYLPGRKNA
ncbi:MAG: hypothetical protein D6741_09150 [Planctomycetota bacterium]|nr:MAG: hypothetical protein D6741_09150 [Planctomycetota bacterium]